MLLTLPWIPILAFFSDNSIPLIFHLLRGWTLTAQMSACVEVCVFSKKKKPGWFFNPCPITGDAVEGTVHCLIGWHTQTRMHTQTGRVDWRVVTCCAPHVCTRVHPSHINALLIHTWSTVVSLALFSLLFPASIVTVIRLVNDAVDDIESEGRRAPFFSHICHSCVCLLVHAKA